MTAWLETPIVWYTNQDAKDSIMNDLEQTDVARRSTRLDALIIGAGPVGLTLAAALTHQGLNYRLIEKAAAPTDKSKALVVWSRTLELVSPMGIADELLNATGIRVQAGSIYADQKRVVHFTLTSDESPYGFPLMLPQSETERVLAEHLRRHDIQAEREVELVAFTENTDSVVCQLRHPDGRTETVETPWLIGCDGAHSTVRHVANIPFSGHAEPNDWMLADVHIDGTLARDEVSVFWHATGTAGLLSDRRKPISHDCGFGSHRSLNPAARSHTRGRPGKTGRTRSGRTFC